LLSEPLPVFSIWGSGVEKNHELIFKPKDLGCRLISELTRKKVTAVGMVQTRLKRKQELEEQRKASIRVFFYTTFYSGGRRPCFEDITSEVVKMLIVTCPLNWGALLGLR
jgi:hypothetical protein